MHRYLYFTCGKCVIVSTSPVGNESFTLHNFYKTHHVQHSTFWKINHCSTTLCEMQYCLDLISGKCIINSKYPVDKCITFIISPEWKLIFLSTLHVGNVPFIPTHLWEMHHGLQHICGKCIIVCTSPMSIASIFPPKLWEIHLTFTFPVDNASFTLPHQWEMNHCNTITSGRCLKFGKCIIVSTSPVGYISSLGNSSWSTHHLWDIQHFLYPGWG